MLWEIRGMLNGREIKADVEASNAESARAKATDKGVNVTSVAPVSGSVAEVATPVRVTSAPARVAQSIEPAPVAAAYGHPVPPVQVAIAMPPPVLQKGVSGFGIAALVIGIIAVLISWVPLLGMIAIPIGLIALLLALIGFIVSLAGGKSGVGMPVAGGVVGMERGRVPKRHYVLGFSSTNGVRRDL